MNRISKKITGIAIPLLIFFILPFISFGADGNHVPSAFGIRAEFILFAATLVCVGIFHRQTFWVAIAGLTIILTFKLFFDPHFEIFKHFFGEHSFIDQITFSHNRQGEWPTLVNLLMLLLGFAVLSKIFETSGVPDILPGFLPDNWLGPFLLLIFVFILSSFLDNIAAALIGGAIAIVVFHKKVHIGFIAAIVAASNAGGSGSVVGDTTTTMMWIDGVSPVNVVHAYIAAVVALFFSAWIASRQQHRHQPIQKDITPGARIDWGKLLIVIMILGGAILSNILFDMPGLGVWIALLIGMTFRKLPFREVPGAIKGTIFLLCLVTCASLMPVEELPDASWKSAFVLGFVSAVFDNIPLTKLCLEQGHFDWGMLAYTVGYGGSMIWFGSSAGVAITNRFQEARDVVTYVRYGWHVTVAYILGFAVLLFTLGWEPASNRTHTEPAIECKAKDCRLSKDLKKGKKTENTESIFRYHK